MTKKLKDVKVSKIEIEIGDKKIPLSLEEAKELSQILTELFGKSITPIPYPQIVYIRERLYPWTYTHWESPVYGSSNQTVTLRASPDVGNTSSSYNLPDTKSITP